MAIWRLTSKGEMFSGGDPKAGTAGYVAIEMVTGTLAGKHGSFALQHSATMDASGPKMTVIVVPGSGTGELKGIAGTFTIWIEGGQHLYDLDYTLPEVVTYAVRWCAGRVGDVPPMLPKWVRW
jgi:hypothetical protein